MRTAFRTFLRSQEAVLLLVLVIELIYFSSIGRRFATVDNACDIARHSVEIGLLALVLTPIILTAGIDLSLGSLLGLSAVLFGKMWRDFGLPLEAAAICTVLVGAVAGLLNGSLVALLRLPPLIVTLGTYSLFRGLAEAITRGTDTFTDFPARFLALGQGTFLGVPIQLLIFVAIALAAWIVVHRMTFGRSLRAIGFSPEGARFAGLPVGRRLIAIYLMAGAVAALAGIIYTARVGQAKADAGTGYELYAITAVVLGGTSIFGGRGTVHGTLLGVLTIAVLSNGLVHARQPREVAGMLTGALLLLALTANCLPNFLSGRWARRKNCALPAPPQTIS